jgi:hypothetical protein
MREYCGVDIPNKKFDLVRTVPQRHGDGSALPMLIQSGNLSLEIWSSGGCRLNCVEVNPMRWRNDMRLKNRSCVSMVSGIRSANMR